MNQNKSLRIGIIGTGGNSYGHFRRLTATGEAQIVALADPSNENVTKFITTFELSNVSRYSDSDAMIREANLDAVVICSPHTLHFKQAAFAFEHGCHVLIEKPMACSYSDAEQLIEIAARAGKVLQVSYQRRYQPNYIGLKQAIERGTIGRLTSVTAMLQQDWAQLTVGLWRQRPELSGGGMLMDSGAHMVDMLLWTTGLTPESVKTWIHQQNTPVEIDTCSSIRFKEGAIGSLNVIGYAATFNESLTVFGENGTLICEGGKVTLQRRKESPVVLDLPEETTNTDKSFLDTILGRQEPMAPESYLAGVRLTEMIYQAGQYFPLQTEPVK